METPLRRTPSSIHPALVDLLASQGLARCLLVWDSSHVVRFLKCSLYTSGLLSGLGRIFSLSTLQFPKKKINHFSTIIHEPLRSRRAEDVDALVEDSNRFPRSGTAFHLVSAEVLGEKSMGHRIAKRVYLLHGRSNVFGNCVNVLQKRKLLG